MLSVAVNSGADAVYFGIDKLNMRAKAKNFIVSDLPEIVQFCHDNKVKAYLTLNTIIFEEELSQLDEVLWKAKEAGIDMIICWDMSAVSKCKYLGLPVCISTQASVSNSVSANFFKDAGAKRIVLARECSLEEIKKIRAGTDIEIEVFVHGAMCIAISGRCFMSHHLFGKSANRGECIQPCRREYEVKDNQTGQAMIMGEDYVLSPKDLCSVEYTDRLIEAGIDSFKIEGRKRSPEYVAKTVSVYRRAIDLCFENGLTDEIKKRMLEELGRVYNRGFSSGFYFDTPSAEEYAGIYGNRAVTRKEYVGRVINYFKKTGIAHIKLETCGIRSGDELLIIGQSTGVTEFSPGEMMNNGLSVTEAVKGDEVTFVCHGIVRPKDMVYRIRTIE
ncbi:MAG: peptidase U32 family protein [Ignavibacteria bacterium]